MAGFVIPQSPVSASGDESEALPEAPPSPTSDHAFGRALDVLLEKTPAIDPESGHLDRYDNCTPLQAAFAERFGLRDPDLPYQPKPPTFFNDNRADRRARRRRPQILRSFMRRLRKEGN